MESNTGTRGFDLSRVAGQLFEPWKKQADNCILAAKRFLENSPWPAFAQRSSVSSRKSPNFLNQAPMFASITSAFNNNHNSNNRIPEGEHLFDVALSTEEISQKLDGIPVYAVCNNSSEFVLVSDSTNQKSLGIFCFRRSDAEALLQQVKAKEPVAGQGAKVIAVSLHKVYNLNADGIAFRFLPDPHQVKNAIQISGHNKEAGVSFDGVPVFQSNNLIVRNNDTRLCPIFFCKEDLDQALEKASKLKQKINPSLQLETDIQVGSFERVVKQMQDPTDEEGWKEVVFIPPGMTALGQLEDLHKTAVG